MPDFTLPYCRKVTQAWCVFCAANSLAIALLALAALLAWWALFTALISYVLMGRNEKSPERTSLGPPGALR